MNIERISLLFLNTEYYLSDEKDVLVACVKAAKVEAKLQAGYLGQTVGLTSEHVVFSIDNVMEQIPTDFGVPTRPDCKKKYKIFQVLGAIEQLKAKGYLADDNDDYEAIQLTDELFRKIASEWAESKGVKRFWFGWTGIWARTNEEAETIYQTRLAIEARGGYVEKGNVFA